jgi:hypothetical protein
MNAVVADQVIEEGADVLHARDEGQQPAREPPARRPVDAPQNEFAPLM